jgi:tetratricopeptide (TPR) repeat protein
LGLLAVRGEQTDFLAYGVRMTLAHGEVEGTAADWLQTLIRLEPKAFRTLELRARSLIVLNQLDEAISLFENDLADGQHKPRELANRRESAAGALSELAQKFEVSGRPVQAKQLADYAETLYRTLYAQDPGKVLLLIRFLKKRHNPEQLAQAVALCADAWEQEQAPPEAVAIACVDLLRSGTPSSELLVQVKTWLTAARQAHPESPEFVFQLANVAHLKGDYLIAESLYRRTTRMSPRASLAYNSLALLLALRGVGPSEALESINTAIEISGPLPFLLDTRASVHLAAENNRLAIRDLEDSIAEAPGAAAYFHLAQAYVAIGDETEARRAWSLGVKRGLHLGSLHPLESDTYDRIKLELQKF